MKSNVRFSTVTRILAITSVCLVASMALYALGLGDWMFTTLLAWPGAFLVQSFGILSLYIPFLFATLAWIASAPVFQPLHLVPLGISVVPFFTLAALLRSLDSTSNSPVSAMMSAAMGSAAPLFLGLLTILEVLVGAVVTLSLTKNAVPQVPEDVVPETEPVREKN